MTINQFKKATNEQIKEYGKSIPMGRTYDEKGKLSTYKNSKGYWEECTYDNGKLSTYKRSDGFWEEWTYDNGNVISYKNSDGEILKYNFGRKGDE